jgi:hypothetical protein
MGPTKQVFYSPRRSCVLSDGKVSDGEKNRGRDIFWFELSFFVSYSVLLHVSASSHRPSFHLYASVLSILHSFTFYTSSVVWKAMNLQTGQNVAIKRMKTVFRSIEQVNSLREIQALRRSTSHPNVIGLHEILYDRQTGRLSLVFELMTCNLYEFARSFFLFFSFFIPSFIV